MNPEIPSSDLERRKHVKLRVRADLAIAPQKYEGRTYYVVKDPVSLRYYRFKEQEHFLLKFLDGAHSLDQAQKEFENRFRPERLTLEDLEQFGQQLLTVGLAQNESPQAGKQLFERRNKRRNMELMQTFTNILYIKIPIFDPEKLLTKMLPWLYWMFTTWFFIASVSFMLAAVMLVTTHFETFLSRLPSYQEFFSFKTAVYLWAALGVVKVIHEFGHGLSCKALGGEVHEMGFLFLCLSPAMYCNVSDAWTLPSKWHRIIISFAGIYVELMIAAAATFIWWNTPSQPFINNLSLSLMVVCSVSTVLFNGNPLMRYDGYYVLADWLEIPNLRDRANRYLSRLGMEHLLGIEVQPEPYMDLTRRILFISYAVVSYVYRWVVTFVILKFMATFLRPYKLEIISEMLALIALGSMVGWPLYRLLKNVHKRGRLPDMKAQRVVLTSIGLAGLLLVFFFVPMPVTRVRQLGLVQVHPDHQVNLHVEVPSILQKLHVKEGETVTKGKVLAEFVSPDLEAKLEQAQAQQTIKENVVKETANTMPLAREAKDRDSLSQAMMKAKAELKGAQSNLGDLQRIKEKLIIRAPRHGVVMGLPKPDEVGKSWDREQSTPFCTIGDRIRLRVLVPVPPADYDLMLQNKKLVGGERHLGVTIRVQGRAQHTWQGHVSLWPEAEAKTIPPALSNKGGGPLAIKPANDPNQLIPQAQVFLVGVDIDDPDAAICPGAMAQVKIHCQYRSCAWWTWRAICTTFDLGLM